MSKFLVLPDKSVIKTALINQIVPLGDDQTDPNRKTRAATAKIVCSGKVTLRVEFENNEKRDEWIDSTISHLNNPSKA